MAAETVHFVALLIESRVNAWWWCRPEGPGAEEEAAEAEAEAVASRRRVVIVERRVIAVRVCSLGAAPIGSRVPLEVRGRMRLV